ncbi:hypothetical protein OC844_003887 [Tilletia horrida]|nr:hypothetical protein OC844_003887 [Tilletia horrida]
MGTATPSLPADAPVEYVDLIYIPFFLFLGSLFFGPWLRRTIAIRAALKRYDALPIPERSSGGGRQTSRSSSHLDTAEKLVRKALGPLAILVPAFLAALHILAVLRRTSVYDTLCEEGKVIAAGALLSLMPPFNHALRLRLLSRRDPPARGNAQRCWLVSRRDGRADGNALIKRNGADGAFRVSMRCGSVTVGIGLACALGLLTTRTGMLVPIIAAGCQTLLWADPHGWTIQAVTGTINLLISVNVLLSFFSKGWLLWLAQALLHPDPAGAQGKPQWLVVTACAVACVSCLAPIRMLLNAAANVDLLALDLNGPSTPAIAVADEDEEDEETDVRAAEEILPLHHKPVDVQSELEPDPAGSSSSSSDTQASSKADGDDRIVEDEEGHRWMPVTPFPPHWIAPAPGFCAFSPLLAARFTRTRRVLSPGYAPQDLPYYTAALHGFRHGLLAGHALLLIVILATFRESWKINGDVFLPWMRPVSLGTLLLDPRVRYEAEAVVCLAGVTLLWTLCGVAGMLVAFLRAGKQRGGSDELSRMWEAKDSIWG